MEREIEQIISENTVKSILGFRVMGKKAAKEINLYHLEREKKNLEGLKAAMLDIEDYYLIEQRIKFLNSEIEKTKGGE
jgi:hypothetical protein